MWLLNLLSSTTTASSTRKHLFLRIVISKVGLLRVTGGSRGMLVISLLHRLGILCSHLRLLSGLDIEEHVVVQLVVLAEVDVVVVADDDVLGELLLVTDLACACKFAVDSRGVVAFSLHG